MHHQFIAWFKKASRQRQWGNSLTFLMVSVSTMTVSLSLTSMMLGPQFAKESNSLVSVAEMKSVGEHHLDKVQQTIQDNLPVFLDDASWDEVETHAGDNLPPYQRLNAQLYNQYFSISLRNPVGIYNETIKSNLTIQSEMIWDAEKGPRYSVIRLGAPYQNVIRLMVEVQAGTQVLAHRRMINLTPGLCNIAQANTPHTVSLPLFNDANPDFTIGLAKGGFVQVGPKRVCQMPTLTGNSVNCLFQDSGVNLLTALRHSVMQGSTPLETQSRLVHLPGTNQVQLDFQQGGTPITSNQLTLPLGAQSLTADIFAADEQDTQHRYQGFVSFLAPVASSNVLQASWGSWNSATTAGAMSTGLTDIFDASFGSVASYGYDPASSTFVATLPAQRGMIARKIPKPLPNFSVTPTFPTLTTPIMVNQVPSEIATGSLVFGKPIIAKGGAFSLVPVSNSTGVHILAMSLNNQLITDTNCSYQCGVTPGQNSAVIMSYVTSPDLQQGQAPSSLSANDVAVWYNAANQKFYWVLRNAQGSSKIVYEWDPETWGNGANSITPDWMLSGNSPERVKSNVAVLGQKPSATGCGYTGKYWTVREIGFEGTSPTAACGTAGPALWSNPNTQPVWSFDKASERLYVLSPNTTGSGNGVFQVNVSRKNLPNDAVVWNLVTADPTGKTMGLDTQSGWLYFTAQTQLKALHAWFTSNGESGAVQTLPVTANFSDGPAGDGNLLYSPMEQTMYYLDVAVGGETPRFMGYRPKCFKPNNVSNQAAALPGYTTLNNKWNLDDDDIN